jgi:FliI/YscN family ATPase
VSASATPFSRVVEAIRSQPAAPLRIDGRVEAVIGQTLEIAGLAARIGAVVRIDRHGERPVLAEVVGFRDGVCIAMPLTSSSGLVRGARAALQLDISRPPEPSQCLGRILDGTGSPLDGRPHPLRLRPGASPLSLESPLERARVEAPLDVGVRAINAMQTIGRGSRMGLFAGSGVGKSTLLGQIARFTEADAIVVALVGERRREVREFVERELGEALGRASVVVATSDEPAVLRRRAALLASDIAGGLAREGRHVLFLMDSLSRFCNALREIGLAAGEPPATRGYPPSVWSSMPQLLERAGTTAGSGSVTGIYTVLVEGDDMDEPVADAARSLLDGHVVLSRSIAEGGAFPPIDPLASLSRVMEEVVTAEHAALARSARAILARLAEAEDLIRIGAYQAGADARLDAAVRIEPELRAFLAQERAERAPLSDTVSALRGLIERAQA